MRQYKCPNCGSNRCISFTSEVSYPYLKNFECLNCGYKSRKVEVRGMMCKNYKANWEIELEKLEDEWGDRIDE